MLELSCAFAVSFLHFCQSCQPLWTVQVFFWPGARGASPLLDMASHCLLWCVMLFSYFLLNLYWSALFGSQRCLLHILILSSMSLSKKYTKFQEFEKNSLMHLPFNKLPLSYSKFFVLIFHMSYISFVLQCPKIKFTWSTTVDFVCVNQINGMFACHWSTVMECVLCCNNAGGCLRSYGLTKCVNVLNMTLFPECR